MATAAEPAEMASARLRRWIAGALLLALAALDMATAVAAARSPYFHAGAPLPILGAAARSLTAIAVALRLGHAALPVPYRRFRGALVLSLLSLWAPRPVWLYTAARPAFDPFAPMVASLVHVIPLSLAAVVFMQAAVEGPEPMGASRSRRFLRGPLPRIAALIPLAGYPMQVPWVWDPTRRGLLFLAGLAWMAILGGCAIMGVAALLRRLRVERDPGAPAAARCALLGIGAAVVVYLGVRVVTGDLGDWAGSLMADLGRPYGPFSFFAVRRSTADSAGSLGFSFALLAFVATTWWAGRAGGRLTA